MQVNKMLARTKKVKNNEFIKTPNYNFWIRNFCNNSSQAIDINKTINENEYFILLKNEFENNRKKYSWADAESNNYNTAIIISDGYDFNEVHTFLKKINGVCFMGVNNSLKKWNNNSTSLNYYVVNNPYQDCLRFLPNKRSLPKCIASNRTYPEFLENYSGIKYRYSPANEDNFNFNKSSDAYFQIDDYRNPICASIQLAYKFNCSEVILLCCDDSFEDNKPGSIQLENGLYTYPQQNIANEIIDCCLYWFTKSGRKAYYHCSGKKLDNAEYIKKEDIKNYLT
jgi:hypothetical protein